MAQKTSRTSHQQALPPRIAEAKRGQAVSAPADSSATFRVAAFQGTIRERDPEASLAKTREALAWADARDAHVLCMPECYLQGYFNERDDAWKNSIDLQSSEFGALCSALAGYRATLLLGLNERRGADLYNTVAVIRGGRLEGRYSKNYLVRRYFTPGLEFPVFERDGVKFGIVICADTSYVEPARILAMRGAEVLFAPHFNRMSPDKVDHHTRRVRMHNRARAIENGCWLVRSNIVWVGDRDAGPAGEHAGDVGVGDSFILNPLGETVCDAGLLTETMLFHAIPKAELGTDRKFWRRTDPRVADMLRAEYARLEDGAPRRNTA